MATEKNKTNKISTIQEKIKQLQEEEKRLVEKRTLAIGKLAVKSKLGTLSDAILKKEFEEIAKRHSL